MRIKRIIAMLLSVLMMLSAFSAYAMTDKEAADRVTAFGWVHADYDSAANVTRAEFAEMMIKFSGIAATGNTVSTYDDIAAGDARLPYINAAVERGIMAPYLNNKFDPDGAVTKQMAAKAVLTVLGYSSWAEASGGYPTGYTAIALGTDMFDGVPGELTSVMTYADVVRVLANSATIPICEPVVSKGVVTYEKNDNKTILTEVYEAKSAKGRIVSNDITAVEGTCAPKDSIRFLTDNGVSLLLQEGATNAGSYVGYNATVYYMEVDGADTVMYIVPDTKTTELIISMSDIDAYSNGSYTYYADGKRKTARVSKDADVIYNGKKVDDISGFTDSSYLFYPRNENDVEKDGTVRLVSSAGSSSYDLVFIEAMECYAVEHYSAANDAIYLKDNKPSLDVEDENLYDIYDVEGNPVELTALTEWDIIEVYRSIDGSYTKYVIVRNQVSGTVDLIRSGSGEHGSIKIDGVEYPYDDNGKIALGTTGVFLLSSTGRVIMMTDDVTHSANFGYIIKAYAEVYEEVIHVRMLTLDGEVTEYESATKVKLDGTSIPASTLRTQANEGMLNRQLVTYELSDGKINMIDTAKQNSTVTPSDLRILYANTANSAATDNEKSTGLIYKKNLNCFGGKIIVNTDTKILMVPDAGSSFDSYTIKDVTGLRNDNYYKNLTAYTLGADSRKAEIIVQEIEGGIDSSFGDDTNIAVVTKITSGINPAGEEAQGMQVYVNGVLQEVYGEDYNTLGKYEGGKFYPLSVGDIVLYNTDSKGVISAWKQTSSGYVSGLNPLYVQTYGGLEMPSSYENNIYGSVSRFVCSAYDKVDGFVGIAIKSRLEQVNPSNGDVVYFSADKANVYIYDEARKKVELGTVDDIETYKAVAADCSKMYISAYKGELLDVVIFK